MPVKNKNSVQLGAHLRVITAPTHWEKHLSTNRIKIGGGGVLHGYIFGVGRHLTREKIP